MASPLILTIDLGTSGPKVAVFDQYAQIIDSAFAPVDLIFTEDGGVEQHPEHWLAAIRNAWFQIKAAGKFSASDIIGINITSQWSGTVAIDKNGKLLMNAIIWMDNRGAPYANALTDGLIKVDGYDIFKILNWINITGGAPTKSGKDSIAHILFIKNKRKDVYEKTWKFLEPKDYLNYYFTGVAAASYDGITLHWVTDNRDINNVSYHSGLLKRTGLNREQLPDLLPTNSVIGNISAHIAEEWGLPKTAQVITGSPDTHSAAVGSGAVKDFEAHLYIGTSSWIICHVPFKKTDLFHNIATIPSSIPGRYITINEQETTGACLNFIKNNVFYKNDLLSDTPARHDFYERADELVASVPAGSNGVMFTPWLNGERSPVDDHNTRASFLNISLNNNRGDMIRAVYEGVALNNKWLFHYLEKMVGRNLDTVRFIGGGANSDVWCQIIADVFGRKILQVDEPILANSRGSALLALCALGLMDVNKIGDTVKVKKEFQPNHTHRHLYEERFEIFKKYYAKNKGIFARLNQR
jgi:xylulokinase